MPQRFELYSQLAVRFHMRQLFPPNAASDHWPLLKGRVAPQRDAVLEEIIFGQQREKDRTVEISTAVTVDYQDLFLFRPLIPADLMSQLMF